MALSGPTVKVLWTRAHDRCAFPTCQQALTEDSIDVTTGADYLTIVGEQAHIRSPQINGPRHDPTYDRSKLDNYDNLILLCPTHHTLIDANHGAGFSVEQLVAMRTKHEKHQQRSELIERALRAYVGQQYTRDDKVLFEQVDLNGPSVDSMFVDVPLACRPDLAIAQVLQRIAERHPPEPEARDADHVVIGSAQALLHPEWQGNALLVGGPGQGKSTLLQYICQFHRARILDRTEYTGEAQSLRELTEVVRWPVRIDLRDYTRHAADIVNRPEPRTGKRAGQTGAPTTQEGRWPLLEQYIASKIEQATGMDFEPADVALLIGTQPILIGLDGLDEVADLKLREQVSTEIVDFQGRVSPDAADLIILVATRPGATTSALWSSTAFPRFNLRRLSHGLRLLYLRRWASVADLSREAREKLERTFLDNENVPHVRELASYPMQLAILLHLLHRRGLLPQRRTQLYGEYLTTFLDREQNEDKEPLLATEREAIVSSLAYLGWYIHTKSEQGKSTGSIQRSELQSVLRAHLAGNLEGRTLADEIFTAFTSRVLCLVEREKDWFQFDVQSLREYFTAKYMFEEGERDDRDDHLAEMLRRPYWSNVCRFYVGLYAKGEVRGILHIFRELTEESDLKLHPMLRSTAGLLLNDRTFDRQNDSVLQEVVDFVLAGPGVVLAEDGLLDVSAGSAMSLSPGAGRAQVIKHAKDRLSNESDHNIRTALLSILRRHAATEDDLNNWWWGNYAPTWAWFQVASMLGIFASMSSHQEQTLAELLSSNSSPTEWATALLTGSQYQGYHDDILRIVQSDINEGAIELVRAVDATTPVGRLLNGACVALLRNAGTSDPRSARTRLRGEHQATVLSAVVAAAAKLGFRPPAEATAAVWQERLVKIAETWKDGWVLFQAIAYLPSNLDIAKMATTVRNQQPLLSAKLVTEAAVRAKPGDAVWWRDQLATMTNDVCRREWVFNLLSRAHSQAVIDLAAELDSIVNALIPRHFGAVRESLRRFRDIGRSHRLVLHDALRLNQVALSIRSLWLIRVVSSDATIEQIDKRLTASFVDLLNSEPGDLRELTRVVGEGKKKIPFNTFEGHRSALPSGSWASNVNIGAMSPRTPDQVLTAPAKWPADLVQRAVEQVERRMLSGLNPIAEVARERAWFVSDR